MQNFWLMLWYCVCSYESQFLLFFTSAVLVLDTQGVKAYFKCASLFLQLPNFSICCILFFIDYRKSTLFFLSMAFWGGPLTVALMVCSLEKYSHPKGTGYYRNWHRGASISKPVVLTFSASGIDGLLRGGWRISSEEPGEWSGSFSFFFHFVCFFVFGVLVCLFVCLFVFWFRFMHFKSFLTEIWGKFLAEKHTREKAKLWNPPNKNSWWWQHQSKNVIKYIKYSKHHFCSPSCWSNKKFALLKNVSLKNKRINFYLCFFLFYLEITKSQ